MIITVKSAIAFISESGLSEAQKAKACTMLKPVVIEGENSGTTFKPSEPAIILQDVEAIVNSLFTQEQKAAQAEARASAREAKTEELEQFKAEVLAHSNFLTNK